MRNVAAIFIHSIRLIKVKTNRFVRVPSSRYVNYQPHYKIISFQYKLSEIYSLLSSTLVTEEIIEKSSSWGHRFKPD